jgi:hypothetical protein
MELDKELAKCEELRIVYEGDRTDFKDDILIDAAKKLGFRIVSSGYSFVVRQRELVFDNDQVYWKPDPDN